MKAVECLPIKTDLTLRTKPKTNVLFMCVNKSGFYAFELGILLPQRTKLLHELYFPLAEGRNKWKLLYSWRFSRYSAPLHWLVHGHMRSDNETVSR